MRVDFATIMDVEFSQDENPAEVILIRHKAPNATFSVVNTGDNGVAEFGINGIGVTDVRKMRVNTKGSSALVSIVFNADNDTSDGSDCWATFGGFDTGIVLDASGQKIWSFGGNVGPPPSGHLNIVNHDDGRHLRISNAVATSCERIVAQCDDQGKFPGPPSGNKNPTAPNVLSFVGDGNLDGMSVVATGKLVDCGEPHRKKGNSQDKFLVLTDGNPFLDVTLDGGNVQLHGPVGPQ